MSLHATFDTPGNGAKLIRDLVIMMNKLNLVGQLSFNDAYEVPYEYMDRIHPYIPVESYQQRAK